MKTDDMQKKLNIVAGTSALAARKSLEADVRYALDDLKNVKARLATVEENQTVIINSLTAIVENQRQTSILQKQSTENQKQLAESQRQAIERIQLLENKIDIILERSEPLSPRVDVQVTKAPTKKTSNLASAPKEATKASTLKPCVTSAASEKAKSDAENNCIYY